MCLVHLENISLKSLYIVCFCQKVNCSVETFFSLRMTGGGVDSDVDSTCAKMTVLSVSAMITDVTATTLWPFSTSVVNVLTWQTAMMCAIFVQIF